MHLLRASAWRRHGCAALAAAALCTFISSYSNDPEDTLHAYAQLALLANDRQGAPRIFCSMPGEHDMGGGWASITKLH
jgi:hypothetical protein